MPMDDKYFRKGFGLKDEIADSLEKDYHSTLVEMIKASDYQMTSGNTRITLAREYGFCYGVDRSVDYAYQTVKKFPDKRIYLTGEIIHNPFVNNRLIELGVHFLSGQYNQGETIDDIKAEDIVILPAFGVTIPLLENLREKGCILVDTTCGSVLNVWKHVEKFTRDGYTALVHGKYYHEETLATASRSTVKEGGKYIIVRDFAETDRVCDYIRNPENREKFLADFSHAVSPDFDPDRDLQKIGVANQTTMLAGESLKIGEMVKEALSDRYGVEKIDEHFRAFDTICSATQDRQDAIIDMLETRPDLIVVICGFNSSNTMNLTNIAIKYGPAFHIEAVGDIIDATQIHHKPAGGADPLTTEDWLPEGNLHIGVTAGASTPDTKVGEVIEKLFALRGENISIATEV